MNSQQRILVVDDEEIMRDVLSTLLQSESYRVALAQNGSEAQEKVRDQEYDVVLLDLMMPDIDGLQVLESFQKLERSPATIILTAFGTIERAVKATKLGAFDFITKPFKNDEILLAVKNALEHRRLRDENLRLINTLRERFSYQNIVGKSHVMQQVFELIAQVAPRRSTVLIQGQSGTGKELVAKAIHAASGRAAGPFVAINCGGIPPDLLESEIFGHVRGAYTGATSSKKGLFEVADGGTLFLDEVATISMEMQAKLLRVIQEREFRRCRHISRGPLLSAQRYRYQASFPERPGGGHSLTGGALHKEILRREWPRAVYVGYFCPQGPDGLQLAGQCAGIGERDRESRGPIHGRSDHHGAPAKTSPFAPQWGTPGSQQRALSQRTGE
jgi:two-component system response regulator PilR (NtrC family)